jgi:hypothetical protein
MSIHEVFQMARKSLIGFASWRLCVILIVSIASLCAAHSACAQDAEPAEAPPAGSPAPAADKERQPAAPAAADDLSVTQARLADRFKRLEEVIGRLAELSASTDPRRAKLLRDAVAQSREQDIHVRFESIVKLLEDERLAAAATNQTELQKELDDLLALLLKADRDTELTSQRERVRKYLKAVARLIRLQRGVRARTEGGDELPELGADQQKIANETGKLGGDIAENELDKKESTVDDVAGEAKRADSNKNDNDEPKDSEAKGADKEGEGDADEPQESPDDSGDDTKSKDPSESDGAKSGGPKGQSKRSESQNGQSSESDSSKGKPNDGKSSESKQGQPGSPSDNGGESGEDSEQRPAQPQDPAERASDRLRDAQKKMEDAREKLDDAERKAAADEQREALKDLEQAKAELERVLRQLREEELERTLTQLVARFRKMLELQNQVYDGTMRLDGVPEAERDHDDEIEAARLGRKESEIVGEADKALLLLHEEGSSVAFPEALEQMRGDMRQIAERLGAVKVDGITQGLEQDVIAALEEMIATMEKAIKDLEKNSAIEQKKSPNRQQASGEPPEPPLVDKLAELKMIRSLQMRINTRTQRYGKMIEGEQAETEELLEALKDLSERQQRVYQATADLQQGRND